MNEYLISRQTRKTSVNPFIKSIYTADPSAHVWSDGRLYVYASRDLDGMPTSQINFKTMDQYHAFSTDDMVNWIDEGEIIQARDLNWGVQGYMWAPDAAFKNGKYYFYFPHTSAEPWNDNWKIGVAISDNPTTGFEDAGYIVGAGGHALIDPSVFIDDDDQAYLYYGGGAHGYQVKLNPDMISLKTNPEEIIGLDDFHEAAWVFKRENKYYLTYSDNYSGNNRLKYAMSDTPMGPWKSMGIYLNSVGLETSHGSVVKYKGEWYAFYHSNDLSGSNVLRSICFDVLKFNSDGTIVPVIPTREGAVRLDTDVVLDDEQMISVKTAEDAEIIVGSIIQDDRSFFNSVLSGFNLFGSTVKFNNVNGFDGGNVNIGFYYSTPEKLAKLRLIVNDENISVINFRFTGGTHTYDGYSNITVKMNPNKNNNVQLIGGNGAIILEAITTQKLR